MSQPAFAALAGATKGALVKWEKDTASPNALALIAFAEAGADSVYILTGKRTSDRPNAEDEMIAPQLADIRRDLLEPVRTRRPNETEEQAGERVVREAKATLDGILRHDAAGISDQLITEATALAEIVNNPAKLSLFRAAHYSQTRKRLDEERELLTIWLSNWDYAPDDSVMKVMATLALEHGVPHQRLTELALEIYKDVNEQNWAESVVRHREKEEAASRLNPST